MIKYALTCRDCGAGFEGWFQDSAAYDKQAASGEIACAGCGGTSVEKALMAPGIGAAGKEKSESPAPTGKAAMVAKKAREAMLQLKQQVEANCENVGDRFPEEARKIHYGESEERGIYGNATEDEHAALKDEGIDVHRIPWPDRTEH